LNHFKVFAQLKATSDPKAIEEQERLVQERINASSRKSQERLAELVKIPPLSLSLLLSPLLIPVSMPNAKANLEP
jgi:hypothetical protein